MEGWLFDVYPDPERGVMVSWLLTDCGPVRRTDAFVPRIYVSCTEKSKLAGLARDLPQEPGVEYARMTRKLIDIRDRTERKVLEVGFNSYPAMTGVARSVDARGRYGDFTLYDVDQSLPFRFMVDRGIFPCGRVRTGKEWELLDHREAMDYPLPDFRTVKITRPRGSTHSPEVPIGELEVGGEMLAGGDREILKELLRKVDREDPDIIFTDDGDHFLLPFLHNRALRSGVPFCLDRDRRVKTRGRRGERSYFTYGRIVYKPAPFILKGRCHMDMSTFLCRAGGLRGLVDLSRLSGINVQELSRLSPGTAISAMQVREAQARGYLVMWKKNQPELFKSAMDLVTADRGGFIFEPRVGIFEDVTEVDFTSMYPAIIYRNNISPETILCSCCPDSDRKVPALGYRICTRREGLLPAILRPLVERRIHFKRIARTGGEGVEAAREKCDILKWLLVTCFGYTGYRNARFGKIECHESITAYGRRILVKAMNIAQDHGLEVLHGIVDSLWLLGDAGQARIAAERIGGMAGIPMEVEGVYKWIVFLPNKANGVGALNRYYGALSDGRLKVRGVEMRRRDTPPFLCDLQGRVLDELARASGKKDFLSRIPGCIELGREAADELMDGNVSPFDLMFTRIVSRELSGYSTVNDQSACLHLLGRAGVRITPGQNVRFVIKKAGARRPEDRVVPDIRVTEDTPYDANAYVRHLARSLESLFLPFGWTEERVLREIRGEPRVRMLDEWGFG